MGSSSIARHTRPVLGHDAGGVRGAPHVVVLHGTGRNMVPVPEMEAFGHRLGFAFVAHAVGDPDRKARVEGPFWFIERNFLAGRQFSDFVDANRAARAWCDQVNAKFRRSLSASSNELYAVERPKMRRLPAWRPEIYQLHQRVVDLEGYIHVDGNIYSVPYQLVDFFVLPVERDADGAQTADDNDDEVDDEG